MRKQITFFLFFLGLSCYFLVQCFLSAVHKRSLSGIIICITITDIQTLPWCMCSEVSKVIFNQMTVLIVFSLFQHVNCSEVSNVIFNQMTVLIVFSLFQRVFIPTRDLSVTSLAHGDNVAEGASLCVHAEPCLAGSSGQTRFVLNQQTKGHYSKISIRKL